MQTLYKRCRQNNTSIAMKSSNLRIPAALALLTGVVITTVYSADRADSELIGGRVAKEIRHDIFSGKRLRASRTVTLEKAGKKVTGQVVMEVTPAGKIVSLAISTNLVAEGIDPDGLTQRGRAQDYLDCASRTGCAGERSNARIAACYTDCAAEILQRSTTP